MKYTYIDIASLKNHENEVVFIYGKINDCRQPTDRSTVLTIKDKTGSTTVYIDSQEVHPKEYKFEPGQVIRIHRATIGKSHDTQCLRAAIGKQGCHFVCWPPNEIDPENVCFLSSKTWTRQETDEQMLSHLQKVELDVETTEQVMESDDIMMIDGTVPEDMPELTPEQIQENSEKTEIRNFVDNVMTPALCDFFLPESEIIKMFEKFEQENPSPNEEEEIKAMLVAEKGRQILSGWYFDVHPTFFNNISNDCQYFYQWTFECDVCPIRSEHIKFIKKGKIGHFCGVCNNEIRMNCINLAIRIEVLNFQNLNLYFVIPTSEIDRCLSRTVLSRDEIERVYTLPDEEYLQWVSTSSQKFAEIFGLYNICASQAFVGARVKSLNCLQLYVKEVCLIKKVG